LGLYNTKIGYILLWWSRIALPIFVITGFIKTIPSELDDAAIAITASPLLPLYIFTQRYIIAGITSGALKG
jgi:ABC-type glycerol-3-phosphate transport system permease component